MSRNPRNYFKTTYYHIMTQGIEKRFIFNYTEEKKYYIKLMHELVKDYKIKIEAYCIMDNHSHIVVNVQNIEELAKFMHRLNTKYSIYYNKKHNRVGYVFRDRYKSEGIYSEKQLNCCIKYVFDNPVKARICEKADEYLYSSYRKIIVDNNERHTFIDVNEEKPKCEDIIKQFLEDNNLELDNVIKNKNKLKELISILKNDYDFSFRKISGVLKIDRERLSRIYKR